MRNILPIVQLVAFDLIILAALLCLAIWIYLFIVNTKIRNRNDVPIKKDELYDKKYMEVYRKENLDAVLAATSKDLIEYLTDRYNEKINNENINNENVNVYKIIKKKWTDTSLNCPQSTESLPILVESYGWIIVWKFRDNIGKVRLFEYHTTVDGEWVRCGEVTNEVINEVNKVF